jgi:hypothetical protein
MTTSPPDWQHGASCDRCGFAHAICTFTVGSLYCIDDPCLNPQPAPILVACEGSRCVAHYPRGGTGICPMCGERVALDDAEVGTLNHDRWDLLAMIERGDYG